MAKDPVCGMMVDEKTARFKAAYENTTYYFCGPGCQRSFEKSPVKYFKSSDSDREPPAMRCCM